jgi:hypothetical protein
MAATISTYTLPIGFSRADVLTQLEVIFSDLGFHAPGISGLITSLQSRSGGGSNAALSNQYYSNASSTAVTGSGTGATFQVLRNSAGSITSVMVNRPGQDYVTGNTVTIPASEIGGAANGATDITVVVNASSTTYGSASTYFSKDLTRNDPWAVMRMEMDETKDYGFTYRGLYINTSNQLSFSVGSSFQPQTGDNYSDLGWGVGTAYRGAQNLDCAQDVTGQNNRPFSFLQVPSYSLWSSNSFSLDINVYRSNLDPNCAFISFYQPDLSSTNLVQNTFLVFTLNKYTTPLWDLDYVFQGGVNTFVPNNVSSGSQYVGIVNNFFATGIYGSPSVMKRMAEFGFSRTKTSAPAFADTYYVNIQNDNYSSDSTVEKIYSRDSAYDVGYGNGPGATINSAADYRAVIKGIPVSGKIAPCPYYFPDEFVLIDFVITTPSQNIQPGDTVTVSPSEVYTVITGGYVTDATTSTKGVLLAVRST